MDKNILKVKALGDEIGYSELVFLCISLMSKKLKESKINNEQDSINYLNIIDAFQHLEYIETKNQQYNKIVNDFFSLEGLKTSEHWQELLKDQILVLDPDGWHRDERFQYEWYEELISYSEFKMKTMSSTCKFKNLNQFLKNE